MSTGETNVSDKPLVLLSNDDGVYAKGMLTLREALLSWADVVVVAPEREQSASSHRITLAGPLRHEEVSAGVHAVDGTPADCVYVALNLKGLLPRRPDLVLSGINHGLNLAHDVVYSGTVAAAREGALRGVRAMAISAERGAKFELVALHAQPLIKRALECEVASGPPLLLNVNYPAPEPKGVLACRLGRRDYIDTVEVRTDPRGRSYYWIGGPVSKHDASEGADTTAIDAGFVSVTPLTLEQTYPPHLGIAAFVAGPEQEEP
jgi:5'-nucleotidase